MLGLSVAAGVYIVAIAEQLDPKTTIICVHHLFKVQEVAWKRKQKEYKSQRGGQNAIELCLLGFTRLLPS